MFSVMKMPTAAILSAKSTGFGVKNGSVIHGVQLQVYVSNSSE
jgi:hypothetical protein